MERKSGVTVPLEKVFSRNRKGGDERQEQDVIVRAGKKTGPHRESPEPPDPKERRSCLEVYQIFLINQNRGLFPSEQPAYLNTAEIPDTEKRQVLSLINDL